MSPMENRYLHRTAKSESSCFICGKFTTAVLASSDDFFYVCVNHIKDSSFCKCLNPPPPEPTEEEKKKKAAEEKKKKEKEEKMKKLEEEAKEKKKEEEAKDKKKEPEEVQEEKKIEKIEEETKAPVKKPEPLVYALHNSFIYLRQKSKQDKIAAEKRKVVLQTLNSLPSPPKALPDDKQ